MLKRGGSAKGVAVAANLLLARGYVARLAQLPPGTTHYLDRPMLCASGTSTAMRRLVCCQCRRAAATEETRQVHGHAHSHPTMRRDGGLFAEGGKAPALRLEAQSRFVVCGGR